MSNLKSLKLEALEQEIVDNLIRKYPGLEVLNYFSNGSTARVFHVRMPIGVGPTHKVDRIIKVFRLDTEISKFLEPNEIFRNEIEMLVSISHTNLVAVYGYDFLDLGEGQRAPFVIMEYLPGAKDLDDWLRDNKKSLKSDLIVELLLQIAYGLQALHNNVQPIVHCDVKFGNLLVGDKARLKVADLGFAKMMKMGKDQTCLYTTHRYFPQKFRHYLEGFENKNQIFAKIPKNRLNVKFDLHYFQGVISDILSELYVERLFEGPDLRNLKSIAKRMNIDEEPLIPRYSNIDEVIEDLKKLQGLYLNRAGFLELGTYTGTRTLRIPLSGSIPFSTRVEKIVSHPLFLRLHNALQLGFTYYVYPGARHSRFEHSLGVFSNVSRYINSLLTDECHSYFRQLVDPEKISTTLLAGLLHDIGQHSFAHGLEDVLALKAHEHITSAFITGVGLERFVKSEYLGDKHLSYFIKKFWPEVNIKRLLWVISGGKETGMSHDLGWEVMHAIINGPLDADKTDYLIRDAYHAGVEYAMSIDVSRFINSLTASIFKDDRHPKGVLAFTWKGAQSAENIILARSQMFWVLYWHHAVRAATAMLAHACCEHLSDVDDEGHIALNQKFYCGAINELLEHLKESPNSRCRELAKSLQMRNLFKRGIEIDFSDDSELYSELLGRKQSAKESNDPLLKDLSRKISEEINSILAKNHSKTRLTSDKVIIDIPIGEKDKLGDIYLAEKGKTTASSYRSKRLKASLDDWQCQVRIIRVFIHPDIPMKDRQYISDNGKKILKQTV